MAQKFPFTTWIYNPTDELTFDDLAMWREVGFTHPMAPRIFNGRSPEELIPWLDVAEKLGLKLIVGVQGINIPDRESIPNFILTTEGPEAYEARFRSVYEKLKGHPALYGFYVADEPLGRDFCMAVTEIYKIQKKVAPELHPFVNYRAETPFFEASDFDGMTFEEWMAHISNDIGIDFLTMDLYGPMINDDCIPGYFKSIKGMVEAAEKAGDIDVWANLLCSAHYAYRIPTEAELRWMVNTSAACGCRGVMWFRFYDRLEGHEYYGSPIDEYGNKTDVYYGILRAQRRLSDHYGELLMSLKRKKTFHFGADLGAYPVFDDNSHELIRLKGFDNGIVSFFEDEKGVEYFCIVNSNVKMHTTFNLYYDTDKCRVTELIMNGKKESYMSPTAPDAPWGGFDVYPGQMRFFRIDKK